MLKKFSTTLIFLIGLTVLFTACPNKTSKVVEINYPTRDYTVAESKLTEADHYNKHAFVYLPAGYDRQNKFKQYPLVILMHGSGGNEYSWGLNDPNGELRQFLDTNPDLKKFILVTPSGVSDKTWNDKVEWSSEAGSHMFGSELRNDLLPFLKMKFNISDDRADMCMAGLSMGSEQTFMYGIGECLDLFTTFGCFGATPRNKSLYECIPPETYIKNVERSYKDKSLTINYLYMTSGTKDEVFYPGYLTWTPVISKWDRIKSFECKEYPGLAHDWACWIQSFKDFAVKIFK